MADIFALVTPDDARALEIKSPVDGKPIGVTVMVRSADCEQVRAAGREHAARVLSEKIKAPTVEMMEAEQVDKVVALFSSWEWGENTWKGEKVGPLTVEKCREIVKSSNATWLVEQVTSFANERANFTKPNGKP